MRLERVAQDLVRCGALPDWVDHAPCRSELPDKETSCVANGVRRLLNDIQVNLCGPEHAWHYRTVQRVLTREGAERAAHVVVEFDPGYQRVDFHFVRVLRGSEAIEHANREAIQILRRETNLERLIFDGRLSVSLLIPDVRIGDQVELGVTIHGDPPVLGGRFAAWAVFDSFNPWFEWRFRVLRPSPRHMRFKSYNGSPEPTIVENAGREDSRWEIVGQKRREAEALTPPWLILHPTLQLSEFESWNEVASLLAPYYDGDSLPDDLAAEVDRIAAAHQDPAERAAEWLRFVQRELRYFAFSLGEGGLTPRPLETIWRGRFGDCKDATALYVAGARRLGLEARAALVSTTHGFALSDFLPATGVFNHCIVRLRLDGVSHWLDPTMPVQFGALKGIFQPHVGWALPVSQNAVGLERSEDVGPLHVVHRENDVTLGPKRTSAATFRQTVDYSYWAADMVRNRIANEGTNGFAQAWLRDMQAVWPGVTETAPVDVSDDKSRNCLTVVSNYEIRDCWRPGDGDGSQLHFIIATGLGQDLQVLPTTQREAAIYLGRPQRVTSRTQLNMPRSWGGNGWLYRSAVSGVAFVDDFRIDGRTISQFRELTISAWTAPAKQAEAYNEAAKRIHENLLNIWARERFGRIRPWVGLKWRFMGGISLLWPTLIGAWLLIALLRTLLARH